MCTEPTLMASWVRPHSRALEAISVYEMPAVSPSLLLMARAIASSSTLVCWTFQTTTTKISELHRKWGQSEGDRTSLFFFKRQLSCKEKSINSAVCLHICLSVFLFLSLVLKKPQGLFYQLRLFFTAFHTNVYPVLQGASSCFLHQNWEDTTVWSAVKRRVVFT